MNMGDDSNAVAGPSSIYRHKHTSSTPIAAAYSTQLPPSPTSPSHHDHPTHVQAIHDFAPDLLASTAATNNPGMYLSFKNGEIIRVHVRDPSGWWDGEIATGEGLENGRSGPRRGWFPSNYVREMGHDGALHRRAESNTKSVSTISPKSRRTNMSISTVHSRQTSTTSHASRTSSSHSHSTNYASSPVHRSMAILPPELQQLLHPILQALTLIDTAIHTNRKSHIQPAAACVISAVRATLSSTDCLVKDSPTLRQYPQLGKERKAILAELSRLVGCAKVVGAGDQLEDKTPAEETKDIDDLAKAGRSVFVGMKRFLQYCNDHKVHPTPLESDIKQTSAFAKAKGIAFPDTSAQSTPTIITETDQSPKSRTRLSSVGNGNARIQETFKMRAASVSDLRSARRRASSPPPPMPNTAGISMSRGPSRQSPTEAGTPLSANFASSSSGRSSPISFRSSKTHRFMGSVDSTSTTNSPVVDTHPQTWDDSPSSVPPTPVMDKPLSNSVDVLEAISQAEDALLSIIAAFIGHIHSHHIGSHPSSHANLIEMTRETIDCVRDVLTVVEAVGRDFGVRAHRPREVEHLRMTKDTLYEVASRLVEGVELIGNAPFTNTAEADYEIVKQQLLGTATATLRAGTECVRQVRLCVPEGSDSFANTPTPRSDPLGRQSTPRPPAHDAAVVMREKVVGQRGPHTLSSLHRKASSLSVLKKRYKSGENLSVMRDEDLDEVEETDVDDEEEEVVADSSRDEDDTLRLVVPNSRPFPFGPQRPPLIHTNTSPAIGQTAFRSAGLLRSLSQDMAPNPRSRSSSLSSPAPPHRMTHRSPSRSADLDKFTSDLELPSICRPPNERPSSLSGPLPRPDSVHATEYSSRSSGASSQTTPVPMTPNTLERPLQTPESSYSSYLVPDSSSAEYPGVEGLRIDTDLTPVKATTLSRPVLSTRSMTMPAPTMNPDIRFWVVAHDYDPREIAFNQDGNMVGASLTVLVEKMTPHDGPVEHTFWTTFFYTFRLFTTPEKLMSALISRYDLQPPSVVTLGEREKAMWIEGKVVPVRLRIYNLLKAWLDTYWRPETDDVVLDTLKQFNADVVSRTLPAMAPRLDQAIRKRQSGDSASLDSRQMRRTSSTDKLARTPLSAFPPVHGGLPPTPVISKSLNSLLQKNSSSVIVNITEFDSLELARQLTIMESKLFGQVAPEDLLQTGKKPIPELKALSTLSNQITGWVADNILNEQDPKKRASLLKFYIKLADKCFSLNNFSTMFAVLAGLNSSIVTRLKKTWEALSMKYKVIMDRLQHVIDHSKNHAAYRARLREAEIPCLPFMGLILTDITFMSDGNSDTRASSLAPDLQLINQDKYNKLGKIAIDFVRYQSPFNFHELEVVQTFLKRTLAERGSSSLDALYRKSLMLEPRQGSERITSAFEKPGWLGTKI